MAHLLPGFIFLSVAGLLLSLFIPRKNERWLSGIALGVTGLHSIGALAFIGWWIAHAAPILDFRQITLYEGHDFEFFINYRFDTIGAVFLLTGSVLTFLVAVFSKYYLHREEGYKRFFGYLMLFFAGYDLIILSGNFETMFVGWEMLGISSFLLIAFYRDRYLPVKNGFKVLSFYRLSDICLMLAMWMCHHVWHKNITFADWDLAGFVQIALQEHYGAVVFIAALIWVAASIKSAQLPFSTWLPRAMEGPTASSAVFYGSLSVHIGVFLLLRTYPFWENIALVKGLVIAGGLLTTLVATSIARVQSTVKTQIAYGSITQIGLMFVEVAMGWHLLAMVHFVGNALLRTYQLLVSPSVLSYLVHHMFFYFKSRKADTDTPSVKRLKYSLYLLSVKEWNLDHWLYQYLWAPFKKLGNQLNLLSGNRGVVIVSLLLVSGLTAIGFRTEIGQSGYEYLAIGYALLAVLLVLRGFSERGDARNAWLMALTGQLAMIIAVVLNLGVDWKELAYYASGATVAAVTGYYCLHRIYAMDQDIYLNHYHGYSYEVRGWAMFFLISCLALSGFPISPTFIGIDLMLTQVHAWQVALIVLLGLNFLFLELTFLRIYTRVFLGQHKKMDHPIAFRSS